MESNNSNNNTGSSNTTTGYGNNNNKNNNNTSDDNQHNDEARPPKYARRRLELEETESECMATTCHTNNDTDLNVGTSSNIPSAPSVGSANFRIFQDAIHGTILMDPVLVTIIDTPQFQRLRDIKQLGINYLVFPGASHNRFEHCIGTSYLCGRMLTSLRELHKNVYQDGINEQITDKDILCVKIAGLCHDLGHGPFSHLFDGKIVKQLQPDSGWAHEVGSCDLFDYMLEKNSHVREMLETYGIRESERHVIKTMIHGTDRIVGNSKKQFLYEIVANKSTGIDCDKFDYLARDTYHIGMKNCFDFERYFKNIRILQIEGQLRICARDKEEFNLYKMFDTRLALHQQVYQHKTTKILEEMMSQALMCVDERLGISSSIYDMETYTNMTDSIMFEILRSKDTSKEMEEAKAILHRIQKRQLYQSCGQINPEFVIDKESDNNNNNITLSQQKIQADKIKDEVASYREDIELEDIYVCRSYFSFGMKDKNPLESQPFFAKNGQVTKCQMAHFTNVLPRSFEEEHFRVYCTNAEKKNKVEDAFAQWCRDNRYRCSPEKLKLDK